MLSQITFAPHTGINRSIVRLRFACPPQQNPRIARVEDETT
jgi:hypothetical protein